MEKLKEFKAKYEKYIKENNLSKADAEKVRATANKTWKINKGK